jgi:hypothetical protein
LQIYIRSGELSRSLRGDQRRRAFGSRDIGKSMIPMQFFERAAMREGAVGRSGRQGKPHRR